MKSPLRGWLIFKVIVAMALSLAHGKGYKPAGTKAPLFDASKNMYKYSSVGSPMPGKPKPEVDCSSVAREDGKRHALDQQRNSSEEGTQCPQH